MCVWLCGSGECVCVSLVNVCVALVNVCVALVNVCVLTGISVSVCVTGAV